MFAVWFVCLQSGAYVCSLVHRSAIRNLVYRFAICRLVLHMYILRLATLCSAYSLVHSSAVWNIVLQSGTYVYCQVLHISTRR